LTVWTIDTVISETPSFDTLTVRTVHRTVITVQNRSDGVIAQPWI